MSIQELILNLAQKREKLRTADVQKEIPDFTRQYIVQNLKELTEKNFLVRFGSGAGTFYTLPKNVMSLSNKMRKKLKNQNLKEHEIYFDFENKLHLKETLDENVYSI